ncbi:MAG: asparaginase [Candidatus Cloacimonetes bacterium]|nr:asparaginase [Candidatus Cloacimonadota bacterium]
MKKKILIITTGGTIAMKHNSPFGVIPNDEFTEHLRSFPQLEKIATIDVHEFSNIPSPFIDPPMMLKLAQTIDDKIENYDGIVVTHGTDTLEESAYFVDLISKTQKPVVFTAAMRSGSELGLDGPRNIVGAVRVAGCSRSSRRGVLVVMNDEIDSARDVVKTDSSKTDTFASPSLGLLGIVDPDKIIYYRKSEYHEKIITDKIESNIDLIKCCSGMDGRFIEASLEHKAKAIVIEAFGRGNVPKTIIPAIEKALLQNVLIVLVSRTYTGRVLPEYGYPGGGLFLHKKGVLLGGDLKGPKMRIRLMALFGKYKHVDDVKNYLLNSKDN